MFSAILRLFDVIVRNDVLPFQSILAETFLTVSANL